MKLALACTNWYRLPATKQSICYNAVLSIHQGKGQQCWNYWNINISKEYLLLLRSVLPPKRKTLFLLRSRRDKFWTWKINNKKLMLFVKPNKNSDKPEDMKLLFLILLNNLRKVIIDNKIITKMRKRRILTPLFDNLRRRRKEKLPNSLKYPRFYQNLSVSITQKSKKTNIMNRIYTHTSLLWEQNIQIFRVSTQHLKDKYQDKFLRK